MGSVGGTVPAPMLMAVDFSRRELPNKAILSAPNNQVRDFGSLDLAEPELGGFTSVSSSGRPSIAGVTGRADRISIPALGIDVTIE